MPDSSNPDTLSKIRAAHGRLDDYFQSTRDALTGPEAVAACAQLRDALEAHFVQEESLYFPTLWGIRPEIEQTLRRLLAAHAGFLDGLDETARLIEAGERSDARARFEALRYRFAQHEVGEEEALRAIT